jgi:L-alanine-DL-glutamate epimerase-like enolase superfamily enzyme
MADLKALGAKVRDSGLMGLKSNLFEFFDDAPPRQWHPGFGDPHEPGCNLTRKVLRDTVDHLEVLREGAGPEVELGLDINYDLKTEGTLKLLRAVEHLDLFWFELDNNNPQAMSYIRSQSRTPIASCETLTGVRQLLPYLQADAVDVAIIDVVWNGAWQALKMASAANAFDVNIAPHNFYGHLATMHSVHFAAAVPNLRIMEHDIDRIPWDSEIFLGEPKVLGSEIIVPDGPGWGVIPNEEGMRAHPAKTHSYLDH